MIMENRTVLYVQPGDDPENSLAFAINFGDNGKILKSHFCRFSPKENDKHT